MTKPMTIILIGSMIVVLGGTISAVGTFLHNKNSSEKSSRIESGVNKNIDLGEYTKQGIDSLKQQNEELKLQLEPFILYAKKLYPNEDEIDALKLLKEDIEKQKLKIKALQTDVNETKQPPKLILFDYKLSKEEENYKLLINFKPTKLQQLGDLEFTITLDQNDDAKILNIKTNPEEGNYYIVGPYYSKISTNKIQANLKFKPVGIVEFPNVEIVISKKTDILVEGSYDLKNVINLK